MVTCNVKLSQRLSISRAYEYKDNGKVSFSNIVIVSVSTGAVSIPNLEVSDQKGLSFTALTVINTVSLSEPIVSKSEEASRVNVSIAIKYIVSF